MRKFAIFGLGVLLFLSSPMGVVAAFHTNETTESETRETIYQEITEPETEEETELESETQSTSAPETESDSSTEKETIVTEPETKAPESSTKEEETEKNKVPSDTEEPESESEIESETKKDRQKAKAARSAVQTAGSASQLVNAIDAVTSGGTILITGNISGARNIEITKNVTIKASGGNRVITPANGNEVAALVIKGNSTVTFTGEGTFGLYIGGAQKGTGTCKTSSNIKVLNGSNVKILKGVFVRNSRNHGVYGDVNSKITLDGGSIYNDKGVGAQGNGLASYGIIEMKSGNIRGGLLEGIHSNGGRIIMTGGSIYDCDVGVAAWKGTGDFTSKGSEASIRGGYIYGNRIGIQICGSSANIGNVRLGYLAYTSLENNTKASNTEISIAIDRTSTAVIAENMRSYCSGNAGLDNSGLSTLESGTEGKKPYFLGPSQYGIINRNRNSTLKVLSGTIDGAGIGIYNQEQCVLGASDDISGHVVIQNCTVRGIQNGSSTIKTAVLNLISHKSGKQKNNLYVQNCGANSSKGGGILNYGNSDIVIAEGSQGKAYIRKNRGDLGGGIYNNGTLKVKGDVYVTENEAVRYGGGICNSGDSEDVTTACNLQGGKIYGNKGATGAGVAQVGKDEPNMTVENVWIYGNTGGKYGLYNSKGTMILKGDARIGFKEFTATNNFAGASNSEAQIYNSGEIRFSGSGVRIFSDQTYGIYNKGTMTQEKVTSGKGFEVWGKSTYGLANAGTIMLHHGLIKDAGTGIRNLSGGVITLNNGSVEQCILRGVENLANGVVYMSGGVIQKNGTAQTDKGAGIYNQGTFGMSGGTIALNKGKIGSGIWQDGVLEVEKKPQIEQEIYLTPKHYVTVTDKCSENFIIELDAKDTTTGRVLAYFVKAAAKQVKFYELNAQTKVAADSRKLQIEEADIKNGQFLHQVHLQAKEMPKILVQYLPNPIKGEEEKISGKMSQDVISVEELYQIRESSFRYQGNTQKGWDFQKDKKAGEAAYQSGNKVSFTEEDLEKAGVPTTAAEKKETGAQRKLELYAVWDQAPKVETRPLQFVEGEEVPKVELKKALITSEIGSTDREDGETPHALDDSTEITKLVYGQLENGYMSENPLFQNIMPEDYRLDTYANRGMKEGERTAHKLTFRVKDRGGNVTEKEEDIFIVYNEFPRLRVPEEWHVTTEDLEVKPLTQEMLLAIPKVSDVEDDGARYAGMTDKSGQLIDIRKWLRVDRIWNAENHDVLPENMKEEGEYHVAFSVTDRFGKKAEKTMKIICRKSGNAGVEKEEYVRYISLKHLDTLDENTKWDKNMLRQRLEKATPDRSYQYSHAVVMEIKGLMGGLKSSEEFENANRIISEKYMKAIE